MSAALRLHLDAHLKPNEHDDDENLRLAAAIYGSMRLKASRDISRRILVEQGASAEHLAYHKALFEQAAHIEDLRDKLAHWMLQRGSADGLWQLIDIANTKTLGSMKTYEVSAESVRAAADDLLVTANATTTLLIRTEPRELPAWRYKPSMLKLLPRKKQTSPQAPAHQPQSSEG